MKTLVVFASSIYAASALAGWGTGGGTPPAREQILEKLMVADHGEGALFDNGLGDIGLLTNRELQPQMTLTKSHLFKADIKIPDTDFETLQNRKLPVDLTGSLGENKSYTINAGDQLDSITLIDRRAAARAALAQ